MHSGVAIRLTPTFHRGVLRAVATTLATAALVGCSSVPGIDATGQDTKPFEEVIRSGLAAEKNAFMLNPPICPGPIPQIVRDRLVAQLPMRLSTYFAEPQLGKEISTAIGVVQHDPSCLYGGGVEWVRVDNLRTDGIYRPPLPLSKLFVPGL
jgi:hypothetical protein